MAIDAQDPAGGCRPITASDTTVLTPPTRGLYIGGAGNLSVKFSDDSLSGAVAVVAGAILPWRVKQVLSTGTTATQILALD